MTSPAVPAAALVTLGYITFTSNLEGIVMEAWEGLHSALGIEDEGWEDIVEFALAADLAL